MSARITLPKPMMLCSKFLYLATIFPQNAGEQGGGGGGLKKIFRTPPSPQLPEKYKDKL
jgi:hypothetical protein